MSNKKHYVDYKVSVWLRIETTGKPIHYSGTNTYGNAVDYIKESLEKGHITSPNELYSAGGLANGGFLEPELVLHGSAEFMLPEENDNQATIEIYEKSNNPRVTDRLIWSNQTTLSENFKDED